MKILVVKLIESEFHGYYDKYFNLLPLYGFNFGIYIQPDILKYVSLNVSTEFDQKGYFPEVIVDRQGNILYISAKTFNMISFGLGVKGNIRFKNIDLFVLLGIRGDGVLGKKTYFTDFNRFLTGLTVGTGFEYNVKKIGSLTLDIQFRPDFTIHDERTGAKYRTIEIKTGWGIFI
jgi:hypothetical protein